MLKTFPPKGEGLYPAEWKLILLCQIKIQPIDLAKI